MIDAVIKLHDRMRAFIVSVSHIGDYRSITPEIEGALAQRGILLMQSDSVTPELQANESPFWWIRTRDGAHIAEGVIDIDPLLNKDNEYDPKLLDNPDMNRKMEGF